MAVKPIGGVTYVGKNLNYKVVQNMPMYIYRDIKDYY